MTVHFNTTAKIGDYIVAIQGDLRILGLVTEHEFQPGPGNYSALTIRPEVILAGSFPTGVERLTLNSNHWDLYRDGADELPALAEAGEYDELIEALTIFRSALKEHGGSQWLSAEHDTIYSGIDPEHFSEGQLRRLEELGWHADSDADSFYHFV